MRSTTRRPRLLLATGMLAATGIAVAAAAPATSAPPAHGSGFLTQAALPTVTSDNITQLAGIPETQAISMEFARTGPFAYVSSLDTISVLDLTDPKAPVLRGTLVNALFENESMTYGERMIDGELVRFVIAAIDIYQASPDDPEHVNLGDGLEVAIVDVTDPDNPTIRSRTPVGDEPGAITTSTHTVQCVDQANCEFAYSAGDDGEFSVLDFRDLDAPVQLKTVPSVAAGPAGDNSPFGDDGDDKQDDGAGHYWDFDGVYGWHTGAGGAEAFDVSDPTNPTPVAATGPQARTTPYNDFIFHNSMRPNAEAFVPNAAPSLDNGNVLLLTEEDYVNEGDEVVCERAGSFQTWYVPQIDGEAYRARNPDGRTPDVGTIEPLDIVNAPVEFEAGATPPATAFCSAHWFDVHQDGFVAQGWYGAGLRIMDVRDPRNIGQFAYATGGATEVWDAYWVPQRDSAGVAIPGQKTNIVYTADAVRGIEVYEVDLPVKAVARSIDDSCPEDRVPDSGRVDAEGNTHEQAIDCIIWWEISNGTSATRYEPAKPVNREQMASFIARLILESGGELPENPEDAFSDEASPVHEENINKLAAAGIVKGKDDGTYGAFDTVNRAQMATFLVRAYEHVSDNELTTEEDYFTDDDESVHEDNINASAAAGFTNGLPTGGFGPGGDVRRDQMASFLARDLDLLVEEGTTPPHE